MQGIEYPGDGIKTETTRAERQQEVAAISTPKDGGRSCWSWNLETRKMTELNSDFLKKKVTRSCLQMKNKN